MKKEMLNMKKELQIAKCQLEKQQQYSRRNNLKFYGLQEREKEDTTELITDLMKEIGVNIEEDH